MGRAFFENYIADRLHDVSKKVSSTIISEVALLLQVASKRAVLLRSLWETGCAILLISFYLIYKMAIGISYFLGYIMT
jgi:hypothetical protein